MKDYFKNFLNLEGIQRKIMGNLARENEQLGFRKLSVKYIYLQIIVLENKLS